MSEERVASDPYTNLKRTASLLGDFRKALLEEGFKEDEAYKLVEIAFIEGTE
ncbi:hypothetical protein SEA_IZZY_42 [Streptomyces phage Izzy]|uniref:Uncharacterized protein n=6 Tax=Likavirus izzy TaxID=1982888 RepID=A0A2U8UTJ2_9CAUD|nr:hypothetical protein AVT27_gp42 [Streptomyces phage Izzy]ATE84995.1 hypothetical protein SEA_BRYANRECYCLES_42 [Streptomyces phage BryanRecycles]ATE85296.1 hypothetical protein SEA_JASH_42 [Streptomyces phage Jash]ATE85372.1 hypothetical protein SEA_OLIYNYK_42 [Streptomyces phage Oliynyk]AWN07485.1 hypothetical protein SEA_EDDASA_42 [Streptomyces phage Eddasa]QDK03973.1 hypothetical protein SEA_RUSTICUS_42 [Streptomyces phage Rusticus]WJN62897.1 hypothetical protein [Streptomyces phage phiS